jgi:hypothetical protein
MTTVADESYMKKDGVGRPSGAIQFLNHQIMPALINAAGDVETALERLAVKTRDNLSAPPQCNRRRHVPDDVYPAQAQAPGRVRTAVLPLTAA